MEISLTFSLYRNSENRQRRSQGFHVIFIVIDGQKVAILIRVEYDE